MNAPALYVIWEHATATNFAAPHPWRAQLHGYIGQFATEEQASRFVAAVQKERAKQKEKK